MRQITLPRPLLNQPSTPAAASALLFSFHLLFSPDLHLLLSLLSSSSALKPFVGFSKPLVIADIAGIPLNWYREEAGRGAAGLSD